LIVSSPNSAYPGRPAAEPATRRSRIGDALCWCCWVSVWVAGAESAVRGRMGLCVTWSGVCLCRARTDAHVRRIPGERRGDDGISMVRDETQQAVWTRQQGGVLELKDVEHQIDRGSLVHLEPVYGATCRSGRWRRPRQPASAPTARSGKAPRRCFIEDARERSWRRRAA
jgi:hypothetical protein